MTGIDRRDQPSRGIADEAQRADLGRREADAAARAGQLAAELPKATEPANVQGGEAVARLMTEVNRLPQEAQRLFFTAAAGGGKAAVETVRRRIVESFPPDSERRLQLGQALARHQGADPRTMSRTALESVAARSVERLGHVLVRVQARSTPKAPRDVVERGPQAGVFGAPVARSTTAAAEPRAPSGAAAAAPSPTTAPAAAPAPVRPGSASSGRRADVFERPRLAGEAASPGALFDRKVLRQAFADANPEAKAIARRLRLFRPRVKPMKWASSARFVAAPGLARIRERLAEAKERAVRARETLAAHPETSLRVLFGHRQAGSLLERVLTKIKAAQGVVPPAAATDKKGFLGALARLREQLTAARAPIGEAATALREVVAQGGAPALAALADVQGIDQAVLAATGEASLLEGRGQALAQMDAGPGALIEGAVGAAAVEAERAVEPVTFTESDMQRIGAGLDPGQRPPQTIWNDQMVSAVSAEGLKQGGLTAEEAARNAEVARAILDPEGNAAAGSGAKALSTADLGAALKQAGVTLENVDPSQLDDALRYVNGATSLADQQERLRKAVDNFQVLQRTGLPKLPRAFLEQQLNAAARIPTKATRKLKEADLLAKFQEITGTLNTGGTLKTKIGKYKLELKVDENGRVLKSKCKKPGLFSKIGGAFKKIGKAIGGALKKLAPIALTVLSFIPQTAVLARLAQAAISTYKAIKSKSLLGIVGAGASLLGAGVAAVAGKAASVAGTVANKVATVANATARTMRAVQAARSGSLLGTIAGITGAVASGVSSVAGSFGERFQGFADKMSDYSAKVTAGLMAAEAARRGDLLGAIGMGASLAAEFKFTGATADKYLRQIAGGATRARVARDALRRGDYLGAASAFSSLAASVTDGKTRRQLQRAAATFTQVGTAERLVRSGDYLGAASTLTQAASVYTDPATRAQMLETAAQLRRAGGAYTRAARGDYLGAAEELSRLASTLPWDDRTRQRLADASEAFHSGSRVHEALEAGDYVTAASLLSSVAGAYAHDEKKKIELTRAARYLEQAAPAYALIRQGDYQGAAAILSRVAADAGLPGSKSLATAGELIQTADSVLKALQTGDYTRAAGLVSAALGLPLEEQARQGFRQSAEVVKAMARLQAALKAKDWAAALEAAGELAGRLNDGRWARTPPIAFTSALSGLQGAIASGDPARIQAEAARLPAALGGLVPEVGGVLQGIAETETRTVLNAEAQAMLWGPETATAPSAPVPGPAPAPASGAIRAAADEIVGLLDAWTFNAQERRILDVIRTLPDSSVPPLLDELEARGYLQKLFDDVHGAEYDQLLGLLAAKGGRAALDEGALEQVLRGVVGGGADFGRGLYQGLVSLFEKGTWAGMADVGKTLFVAADPGGIFARFAPEKRAEGLRQLSTMAGAVKQRLVEDWNAAKAQGKEAELVARWSTQGVLEVATFFVGAGEVKAAVNATRLGAKLGRVTAALGRIAGAAERIGGWEKVAEVLRRVSPGKADELLDALRELRRSGKRVEELPEELLGKLDDAELEDLARRIETAAPPELGAVEGALGPRLPSAALGVPGWPTLPAKAAENFVAARPVTLPKGTKIYRIVDDAARPDGSWWSLDLPGSKAEWRSKYAVLEDFNKNGKYVEYVVTETEGLRVWLGPAASQRVGSAPGWIQDGGASQVWLPPGSVRPSAPKPTGWGG